MENSERIESANDFADTPTGLAQRWSAELEASKKELEKFHDDADKITRRYLDKRDEWQKEESRVNLFWSSTKVLLSLLYARPPKASAARAFLDADDDQARVAGQIVQRLLNKSFDDNISTWDAAIRQGIEDWLVVGLGQIWLRYEVETALEVIPAQLDPITGEELAPEQTYERIVNEDAPVDYIYWKDFFWSPARTWNEVRWVARRVYMTRDQLMSRFGEEIGKTVPLQTTQKSSQNDQAPKYDPWAKAEVFEIWEKETKRVYWMAKGSEVILDVKDDPLQLDTFFPCPKPLAANVTSSNFMPRADYIFAQDQFNELDEINTRITWLTRAAKVAGVYDKAAGDSVGRMFSQAAENQLIPVDNWAMFAESGGVKGKVDFAPIEQVVNCIERLRQYRQDKTMQIYEVLGISDVMRGSSKASETATAQQIKAQFGSTRIQLSQFYIAEWITHALRIKADIISKHFQPETIATRSNIMRTPDAQYAQAAIALIKDEQLAEYRISVEADSMAAMDYAAERDAAVQFMQGLGAFVSQVAPMAQQVPGAAPYLLRLLQWSVSKFRVSSEIEGVLDQAIGSMQQTGVQPQEPSPMQQAEMAAEVAKAKEREANARETAVDTQAKVVQMNAMARAAMQPNPAMPSIVR
jgi:AraC-like DNA-binding protein